MNKKDIIPFKATHPGEMIKDEIKERGMTQKKLAELTGLALEKALDIPADIWMNMQTQYNIDSANIAKRDSEHQTVTVTIPVRDHNLLQELVRRFGWACVF